MKSIVLIIPYFGNFNNYFNLFILSCKYNPSVTWMIFTDIDIKIDLPENVKIIPITFAQLKKNIQKKFDFDINLEKPYKLCDYKPAYGYIFEEYIKNYDFWGHCDCDMIFGDIRNFITDSILNEYDKIFEFGHLTLYRNNGEINKMFMKPVNGINRYKDVYSNKKNCSFDEEHSNSINDIFDQYKKKIYLNTFLANTYTKSSMFKLTEYNYNSDVYSLEKFFKSIFIWNEGKLYRYYIDNSKLQRKEYIYIHFQSRKMKNKLNKDMLPKNFKIIPNEFTKFTLDLSEFNISAFKKEYKGRRNLHTIKLRSKNLKIKIFRKLNLEK